MLHLSKAQPGAFNRSCNLAYIAASHEVVEASKVLNTLLLNTCWKVPGSVSGAPSEWLNVNTRESLDR